MCWGWMWGVGGHVGECMYVWVDVWGSYECVGVHVHRCVGGVKWRGGGVK